MESLLSQLQILFSQYQPYLSIIGISTVVALLATPLTGALAYRIGAVDKPAHLRERNDPTRVRKIHTVVMPQLGGVAVLIGLLVGLLLFAQLGAFAGNERQFWHLLVALFIVAGLGFWDSITDVPAPTQFGLQILAALVIVTSGLKISTVELGGTEINFAAWNFTLSLGEIRLFFSPVADLLSIIWIVGLINAINWLDGIDGLASSISLVAALTLLFLSVKFLGINPLGAFGAACAAALSGAILGYLPFNLPPARTYGGGVGVQVAGLVLAVLALTSSRRLSASLILLALPVIDAAWVLVGRYLKHKRELKSPLDLLRISDKTHIHHRLLALGFTTKQTLGIILAVYLIFCAFGYYMAGFREETLALIGVVAFFLGLFAILRWLQGRVKLQQIEEAEKLAAQPKVRVESETPEERYAY